ncbi:MAG: N-acetylglucosamine-6-phosphate deacetylase [Pirellulales bacterium]|nr:N-acetylglucosamine-6-phosphate deacetylase [Pirellulales bacterium]
MMIQGFFDLQVNGYAGVDFNRTDITVDSFSAACARLRSDGIAGILVTVITDHVDAMAAKLAWLCQLREQDPLIREMVYGFHIEGPFINPEPGFVGAHPVRSVIPADLDSMRCLLDAAGGLTRIVTLAPEKDPGSRITRYLADQSIVVSAGHTDASLDQLRASMEAGLTMFTHLGNGCPKILARHDNIIQRVLSLSDRLWISFIADGFHIPIFALENYLARTGIDRAVIITDAISAAGLGPGRYTIGDQEVDIGSDLVPYAEDHSHFIGSATIMPRVVENLMHHLHFSHDQVRKACDTNPRQLLGLEH